MVDKARFELATSALRRQRSTGLIYLPIGYIFIDAMDIKFSHCSMRNNDKKMFHGSFNLYPIAYDGIASYPFQNGCEFLRGECA